MYLGLDMGEVCGHPGRVNNVVERQFCHGGIQLEQQRQRLPNT
jgi:hypothetical protein